MIQMFLVVRVFHVLFGAAWLGAAVFNAFFLMPAMQEAGPDAGKVMAALMRRKLPTFVASISGLTVLSGLYLYWRFTNGFDPALRGSRSVMVFGTGGVLGMTAAILAVSVVTRSMKRAVLIACALLGGIASPADGRVYQAGALSLGGAYPSCGWVPMGAAIVWAKIRLSVVMLPRGFAPSTSRLPPPGWRRAKGPLPSKLEPQPEKSTRV